MIGSTISHYKILEKLGEGGMGVVYKAQDTTLDRLVALKFLPDHVSAGSEELERFVQEAKAAAALNHPNICTIYGIESANGPASAGAPAGKKHFIAMEFVDGQTVQEKKSSLSFKQALDAGIQIAEGLAAAHEKGIVHRDIKPENIMMHKDGRVQIMDFGLAKLRGVSRLTKEGSTVGTAGYMSPEQIQGADIDHRSDIFSLGVLLFEMLTKVLPFKGVHETAMAYEIVNVDSPPMSSVNPDIPPELDAIVLECLEKDPKERTQSAGQVAVDLKRYRRSSSRQKASRMTAARPSLTIPSHQSEVNLQPTRQWKTLLPWIIASVLTILLLLLGIKSFSSSNDRSLITAVIAPPEKMNFYLYGNIAGPAALSPDGKRLAFVAADSAGKRFLYVRSLDALVPKRLAGTESALHPFWSPDNQFIGFFSQARLKKIDASGGAPITICNAANSRGGTWNKDGTIIFTPGPGNPLSVVSAAGGTETVLTKFDSLQKENSHRWPSFLPDGGHFLYLARSVTGGSQGEGGLIRVASLDGKTHKTLVPAISNAVYASGHILYVRGTTLVAHPFDESSLELNGEPITIAENVTYDPSTNRGMFTGSSNGVLVYQTGEAVIGSRLMFYDRSGKSTGVASELSEYYYPRLSPDGNRVSSYVWDSQSHNADIWITDFVRRQKTRFTFNAALEINSVWSPDGSRLIFDSNAEGKFNLYQKATSHTGGETLLLRSNRDKNPCDWSKDGKFLLYQENGGLKTQIDLWVLPLNGNHEPVAFLQTEFNEVDARFSPDGRWIVYVSDESGQMEVYIRSFQEPGVQATSKSNSSSGEQRQVSVSGGDSPRWRGDGKEIYYFSHDNKMMAADISVKNGSIEVSQAHPLFEFPSIVQLPNSDFDVTSDGKKFLINVPFERQNQTPLTLVLNWELLVKKK
ncbi:MAG: prkC 32 [Bacteroidetes bacterium]|nr:prkC 32 [Bacteroidota bacterium]